MPDWAKKAIVGGGLAAFAGKKLGVGSLITAAAARRRCSSALLSKSKPLPVFVVNQGFGGGAGALAGEGGAVLTGGRGSRGRAASRRGRIGARVKGGVKAAAAFAAIDALTHFIGGDDVGDENASALNNTLTGASLGSFGGPPLRCRSGPASARSGTPTTPRRTRSCRSRSTSTDWPARRTGPRR
jgi:hypothetical protein